MTNFSTGFSAELTAARYLKHLGFEILRHRYKTKLGEIDLVVKKQNLVVFVEVKIRKSIDDARWAISERQKSRITGAAGVFVQENGALCAGCSLQFDVILISPTGIQHIQNVDFEASLKEHIF